MAAIDMNTKLRSLLRARKSSSRVLPAKNKGIKNATTPHTSNRIHLLCRMRTVSVSFDRGVFADSGSMLLIVQKKKFLVESLLSHQTLTTFRENRAKSYRAKSGARPTTFSRPAPPSSSHSSRIRILCQEQQASY